MMPIDRGSSRLHSAVCAVLLTLFGFLSFSAIDSKGAAYDEPYHALSAWLQLHHHDYRIDNEDPPLWQYWASLLNGRRAIIADFHSADWLAIPQHVASQWHWGVTTLYRTPGNDPKNFIRHCRMMMLVPALLLGILTACWAWKIAGKIAAVIAVTLFALDPNFLAHSALMKNDVAFALSMFALARALWNAGRELTWWRAMQIALLCLLTLTVKFSGLVAILLVPVLLLLRAGMRRPWRMFGRDVSNRWHRAGIIGALILSCVIISYAGIWAVYGFRFRPTPEAGVWLNLQELATRADQNAIVAGNGGVPEGGVPSNPPDTFPVSATLFANRHGLLPQPFLAGFLFTYANGLVRATYLCGQISLTGWWWYFPFAMLVKTPISTIVVALFAGGLAVRAWRRRRFADFGTAWPALCLLIPFALFLSSAMASNLNIGIRHVLAIYPFAFVAIGWAMSRVWERNAKRTRIAILLAGAILGFESLSAYPDFIPFFNVAARTLAGPVVNNGIVEGDRLALLSDSNLDWGQDLPLLAQWQKEHPQSRLYLSYFGYEDPAFYGIRYTPLPGGYFYDPPWQLPDGSSPAVLAVSATNLQGQLETPRAREFYQSVRKLKLIEVLGGTIYLFDTGQR